MNKSLWLVRLLSRHGRLSKQEILDAWRDVDEKGQPMAASTFYDNRRYLEERYNIRLICRNRLYSIEHIGDSRHPIVEQMLRSDVWEASAEAVWSYTTDNIWREVKYKVIVCDATSLTYPTG